MRKDKFMVLGMVLLILLGGMTINVFAEEASESSSGHLLSFGGGNGTVGDPYQIKDVNHLQNMSNNLTAHYVLVNDIDASNTSTWDGNLKSANAYWKMDETSWDGTSGEVLDSSNYGNNGTAQNGSDITTDGMYGNAGYFNGVNQSVHVSDDDSLDLTGEFTVTAWINISEYVYLGGIVSKYHSSSSNGFTLRLDETNESIDFCEHNSTTDLTKNTWYHVAGVYENGDVRIYINGSLDTSGEAGYTPSTNTDDLRIGSDYSNRYFNGSIDDVRLYEGALDETQINEVKNGSQVTISGTERGFEPIGNESDRFTGSLDGQGYNITGMYINRPDTEHVGLFGYTGTGASVNNINLKDVNITGGNWAGGLIGRGYGNIIGCSSNGTINAASRVGGLAGEFNGLYVNNSWSAGVVTATSGEHCGGLFGYNTGTLNDTYSTAEVTGMSNVGGLVGTNFGVDIYNSYAAGNVSGSGNIGGLVGYKYQGTVENSYAVGDVNGDGNTVGGLVAHNHYGTVNNSYATGHIYAEGYDTVGGLIGYNQQGKINNSYAIGDISGNDRVGGLVGRNRYDSTLSNSFATGNVSGNHYVGGLVGSNVLNSLVEHSYANVNVNGSGYDIGGLVGYNGVTVSNSHAYGDVIGSGYDKGGLIGDNRGEVTASFYHEDMPRCSAEGGGSLALNDSEFNSISTFESAGWDIEMVTTTRERPYLSWEDEENNPTWYIQKTEKTYNLTINIVGGGSTAPSEGEHTYSEFAKIVIEATADEGYYFTNWTVDVESDNNRINLTMDGDKTITANFEPVDYQITDWEQLYNIRYDPQGDYTLMNDLDKNSGGYEEYVNTTNGWDPITNADPFNGIFDGQGHEIRDFYINRSNTDYIGLFGISTGYISDVGIVDAVVIGGNEIGALVGRNDEGTVINSFATGNITSTKDEVGGLVGYNYLGTVDNSNFDGDVNGDYIVGGLVGYNVEGDILNSSATGNISGTTDVGGLVGYAYYGVVGSSYFDGNVDGDYDTGGLVGDTYYGIITNSYSKGYTSGTDGNIGGLVGRSYRGTVNRSYSRTDVDGQNNIGGLLGYNNQGTVQNSYSTGYVSGDSELGGLVGMNDGGTIENSFWDNETSGLTTSGWGTGKSTMDMKDVYTFTNTATEGLDTPWDFVGDPHNDTGTEDIWDIEDHEQINDGYPYLVWMDTYSLTLTSTDHGTVITPVEGTYEWDSKQVIELEAVADENCHFVEWTGDNVTVTDTKSNKTTVTVDGDYTITAEFALDVYELNIDSSEGGVVFTPGEGTYTYDHGTVVDIVAEADTGYHFVEWTGDVGMIDEVNSSTTTISMEGDYSITAVFEEDVADIDMFELSIDIEGEGTVIVDPDQDVYANGTLITLTAMPSTGWTFVEWTGDANEDSMEISVTMDSNKTITAHFEETEAEFEITDFVIDPIEGDRPLTVNITAEIENIGDAEGTIILGTMDEIFNSWTLGPGDTATIDETYTFEEVGLYHVNLGEESIAVNVGEVTTFDLDISTEGEGSLYIDPELEKYEEGSVVTLKAEPSQGWEFIEWQGTDEIGMEINLTMDENKTIVAVFQEAITGPIIEIDDPEDGAVLDMDSITITWTSEEGTYSISHYEIRLNGNAWEDIGTAVEYTFEDLDDGEYTVDVKVIDMDGHEDIGSIDFTVDAEEDDVTSDGDDDDESPFLEPMILGLLVLVVAIISISIFLMMKRKPLKSSQSLEEDQLDENDSIDEEGTGEEGTGEEETGEEGTGEEETGEEGTGEEGTGEEETGEEETGEEGTGEEETGEE